MRAERQVDVAVVGAGFSGLYLLHRLREKNLSAVIFEKGDGVGGTWYWNRYPGARCDVESPYYSYSFSSELEQEWEWSERYATQPEILRYLNHVADRFDLHSGVELNTEVTSAVFNDDTNRWAVTTGKGEVVSAKYCIMATGCLSAGRIPDFDGMETFTGETYHTGSWPHEGVDFTGKRVGVIGTGSSGIQSIPKIAEEAGHLTVFQRTPNFSVPAHNSPLDPELVSRIKAEYAEVRQRARYSATGMPFAPAEKSALEVSREETTAAFEIEWLKGGGITLPQAFNDLMIQEDSNALAADFVRSKIEQTVEDPQVAELLKPRDHPIGTKRICVDSNYYATFNRENVSLVDVKSLPIIGLTERGLKTSEGEYELDALVFATGFDAMTGALLNIDIRGSQNESLRDKWEAGPRTYLGLSTAGFPNLFTVTGPGSPSVLSNMITSIEQHVDWITEHIEYLEQRGLSRSEALPDAEDAWVDHVNEVAGHTLYMQANSWYLGANIPGKPRVFMPYVGGVGNYRQRCDEVAANDYEGFILS